MDGEGGRPPKPWRSRGYRRRQATPWPRRGARASDEHGICGTDLKIFTGAMPAAYPVIMGHEISGEVSTGRRPEAWHICACGSGACPAAPVSTAARDARTSARLGAVIGREVNGGFADYVVAPRSHVYPSAAVDRQPDGAAHSGADDLSSRAAARRRFRPASRVAVMGLGVSGQLHVTARESARRRTVIGITRSAWKRALAERLGADLTACGGDEGVRAVQRAPPRAAAPTS